MLDRYGKLSYNGRAMNKLTRMEGNDMENGNQQMKFCKHCGAKVPMQAVICTACGGQIEELKSAQQQPNIVINNANTNTNNNTNINAGAVYHGRRKNKWIAFFLCLFFGYIGAHKFYEGKTGAGILYLFTCGIFGIGYIIDIIALLCKPNPYYV